MPELEKKTDLPILMQQFIRKFLKSQSDDGLQETIAESLQTFRKTPEHQTFQEKVKSYGLELHDVARDGNCFFSAVLDQLQYRCEDFLTIICQRIGIEVDQITQETLRHLAVGGLMMLAEAGDDLILSHTEDIHTYLKSASQDNVWADEMMTAILCRVLGITVVLLNSDGDEPTIIHGGDKGTIYLGYEVQRHFQSTRDTPNESIHLHVSNKTRQPLQDDSAIDLAAAYRAGNPLSGFQAGGGGGSKEDDPVIVHQTQEVTDQAVLQPSVLTPTLTASLKEAYRHKTLKGIAVPFENKKFTYEEMYITLELKDKENTPIPFNDLASIDPDSKKRITWLEGDAGMGKTTLARRIVYQWASETVPDATDPSTPTKTFGSHFQAVLYLPLRHMIPCFANRDTHYSIEEFIDKSSGEKSWGFFAVLQQSRISSRDPFIGPKEQEELKRLLTEEPSSVLLILDGLDEVDSDHVLLKELLLNEHQGHHCLVTTRPCKVPSWLENSIGRKIVNRGFNEDARKEYVEKYYASQRTPLASDPNLSSCVTSQDLDSAAQVSIDQQKSNLLKWLDRQKHMDSFMAIPLNCHLICVASSGKSPFPDTITNTQLYDRLLIQWIKLALTKSQSMRDICGIKGATQNEIKESIDGVVRVSERDLLEKSEVWLKCLEEISFRCIKAGDDITVTGRTIAGTIENQHCNDRYEKNYEKEKINLKISNPNFIQSQEDALREKSRLGYKALSKSDIRKFLKELTCFGVIKRQGLDEDLLLDKYEYTHKSFLEYFAGCYIARYFKSHSPCSGSTVSKNRDELQKFLFDEPTGPGIFKPQLSLVLRFASGALDRMVKNGIKLPNTLKTWMYNLNQVYLRSFWGSGPLLHMFGCLLEINHGWDAQVIQTLESSGEEDGGGGGGSKEKEPAQTGSSLASAKLIMMSMLWGYVQAHSAMGDANPFDGTISRLWYTAFLQIQGSDYTALIRSIEADSKQVTNPTLQAQAKKALHLMQPAEERSFENQADGPEDKKMLSQQSWIQECLNSHELLQKHVRIYGENLSSAWFKNRIDAYQTLYLSKTDIKKPIVEFFHSVIALESFKAMFATAAFDIIKGMDISIATLIKHLVKNAAEILRSQILTMVKGIDTSLIPIAQTIHSVIDLMIVSSNLSELKKGMFKIFKNIMLDKLGVLIKQHGLVARNLQKKVANILTEVLPELLTESLIRALRARIFISLIPQIAQDNPRTISSWLIRNRPEDWNLSGFGFAELLGIIQAPFVDSQLPSPENWEEFEEYIKWIIPHQTNPSLSIQRFALEALDSLRKRLITQLDPPIALLQSAFNEDLVNPVITRVFANWYLPTLFGTRQVNQFQLMGEVPQTSSSVGFYKAAMDHAKPDNVRQGEKEIKTILQDAKNETSSASLFNRNAIRNIIGGGSYIDENRCAISLLRSHNHAYLILERLGLDGKIEVRQAELLHKGLTNQVSIENKPLLTKDAMSHLKGKNFRSWAISKDQYRQARAQIEEDTRKAQENMIRYVLAGGDPNQESDTVYHNCFSWALHILDKADSRIRPTIRNGHGLIYDPKGAIPDTIYPRARNLDGTENDAENEIQREDNCSIM